MSELEDAVKETVENPPDGRLNSAIAALVAVTATFMAVSNIKDGNIVQAMSKVQTKAVDAWSFYQAKSTKQHIAEQALENVRLRLETEPSLAAETRARLEKAATKYDLQVQKYASEKEAIRKQAEGFEKEYDELNVHDDQFDMAEACLSIAIALFGITALTRKRWLFFFAFGLSVCGTILSLAGFLGWKLHPEWLAKILG